MDYFPEDNWSTKSPPLYVDLNFDIRSAIGSLSSDSASEDTNISSDSIVKSNSDNGMGETNDPSKFVPIDEKVPLYTIQEIMNTITQENGEFELKHFLEVLMGNSDPDSLRILTRKLSHGTDEIREQNQLEFVTVLTIIKVVKEVNFLLSSPCSDETMFNKSSALCLSIIGLFKHHFQLPLTHDNFGFKNFGQLLGLSKSDLIKPFLSVLFMAPKFDFPYQEKMKALFSIIVSFHFMNKYMLDSMLSCFREKDTLDMFSHIFATDSSSKSRNVRYYNDGLHSLFTRFNDCLTLDQSTLSEDRFYDSLINLLLPGNFDSVLAESITYLLQLDDCFKSIINEDNNNIEGLTEITLMFLKDNLHRETILLYCFNNPTALQKLYEIANIVGSRDLSNKTVLSNYLLLKISEMLIVNFPLVSVNDEKLLRILIKTNNSNFKETLGITDKSYKYSVNKTTITMLFELIDHNTKLDLITEKNLLQYVKISLNNINYNLNSIDSFLNIHSLLNDMGSRLSLHAVVETIQFVLLSGLNKLEFAVYQDYREIPKSFEKPFGFDFVPPVGKFNFTFEDNLNHSDNISEKLRAETLSLFTDIENSVVFYQPLCTKLIQDCLVLCSLVKSKVYNFLREINDNTGIMKFSTNQQTLLNDDKIYKFRQRSFSQLALFRSGHGLDFKILSKAVELQLHSSFTTLILKDNYAHFDSSSLSNFNHNKSVMNIINHQQIDSLMSYLLIYKEFGLFSLLKFSKIVLLQYPRLIQPCSQLLSDLLVYETTSNVPKLQFVSKMIQESDTLSNLIRQFIELFDDGYSNSFKNLINFLKSYPSPIKPSKIQKGLTRLELHDFATVLGYQNDDVFINAN